jgi:CysZ protein
MPTAPDAGTPPPAGAAVQAAAPSPCRWCGYPRAAAGCTKCGEHLLSEPGGVPIARAPRRGFFVLDVGRGFYAFFRALVLLFTRPEFTGKLRLPVLANLIVVTATAVGLWLAFRALFHQVAGEGDLLGWFTGILAPLLALVSTYFLLPPLVELVLSPFLEPLVDVVDQGMGGSGMQPVQRHLWHTIKDGTHAAAQLVIIAGFAWLASLVLSIVGLLPIAFLVAAFVNALTWFELPAYRRGLDLRERFLLLRHNWALAVGFGLGFQVGALIPLFNVFLLTPTAAVAAAMLYLRMEKVPPASRAGRAAPAQGST